MTVQMDGAMARGVQTIGLHESHKASLVLAWRQWRKKRVALDKPLESAMSGLDAIPSAPALWDALLARGVPVDREALSPTSSSGQPPMAQSHGAAHADVLPPAKLRRRSSSPVGADAAAAMAAAAPPQVPPLVGQDAAATAVAAAAMADAADAHARDLRLLRHVAVMLTLPSPMLSAQRHSALWDLALEHGLLCFDHMYLCKLAADEQRHSSFLRPLPVNSLPLPE